MNENGETLPLEATLTDHGQELAHQLDEYEDVADTPDITEYTDQLDTRVTQLESQLDQHATDGKAADADLNDLQEQLTDLDRKLEALYHSMARFRDYLNERDDGAYSEYAEQHQPADG